MQRSVGVHCNSNPRGQQCGKHCPRGATDFDTILVHNPPKKCFYALCFAHIKQRCNILIREL